MHRIENKCYRTGKYIVCRLICVPFSLEILQAAAVKGLKVFTLRCQMQRMNVNDMSNEHVEHCTSTVAAKSLLPLLKCPKHIQICPHPNKTQLDSFPKLSS